MLAQIHSLLYLCFDLTVLDQKTCFYFSMESTKESTIMVLKLNIRYCCYQQFSNNTQPKSNVGLVDLKVDSNMHVCAMCTCGDKTDDRLNANTDLTIIISVQV